MNPIASPAEKGWRTERAIGTAVDARAPDIALPTIGNAYPIKLKRKPRLAAARPHEMTNANLKAAAPFPLPPRLAFR